MKVVRQQHCWHDVGGHKLVSGGVDYFKCCRCGRSQHRPWTPLADWEHGPHVPVIMKRYADEPMSDRKCLRTVGQS